ncbi:hypothetical protein D3C78_1490380 [compost metagenome]
MVRFGLLQIVRDASHTDDLALNVIERQFLCQAPAGLSPTVQVHFQLVLNQCSLLQYPQILFGITRAKLGRKHLRRGFSQQRRDGFKAAALGQRQVGQQVTRLQILDKKHHIGNSIEQRGDQSQRVEQIVQGVRALLCQAIAPA